MSMDEKRPKKSGSAQVMFEIYAISNFEKEKEINSII